MRIYPASLVFGCLLFVAHSALAASEKAIDALKAAGCRAGNLKDGGSFADVPGPKLSEAVWKDLDALGDLKAFSGSGKEYDNDALARLAKITTIESVFFNGPTINDKGLATLASFPNLHKYGTDHGGPKLNGSGLSALAGVKNLQIVSFGGCFFNDEGMVALGQLNQLHELSLNHDRLTSAGFPNFAKLTELEKLRINPNFYPYYVGADLVHLSNLKHLTDLTIGQMIIPYDDGLSHLKSLKQLKKLKLDNCGITIEDLAKLKSDLPDTAIDFIPASPESVKKWNDAVAKKKGAKGEAGENPGPRLTLVPGVNQSGAIAATTGTPKPLWSFRAPVRTATPPVHQANWVRNPIDAYVLALIEQNGLKPSASEQPEVLLRRLYLDLIGLPPTPAQVQAFVSDRSANAYQRVVDELLASPRFGEKWARPWLDLARYADSNGYQRDGFRKTWPYRDWVIRALNRDEPYDQFAMEQLAGDLLPNATIDQKVATGFNRGTTVNVEAGTVPEADRVGQVVDRVNVMGTAFLGLTIGCAQCHDHKSDPITQRDYYKLFAYFNQTPLESKYRGKDAAALDFTDAPSVLVSGTPEQLRHYEELTKRHQSLLKDCAAAKPDAKTKKELAAIEKELAATPVVTSLVMQDATPRETFILKRGQYNDPMEKVEPGTPAALPAQEPDAPANRLGLAHWIASSRDPLFARVAVNRWWGEIFGRGIVATPEDFGTQGERPSHPALLDWLAVELEENGWSMKHVLRLIVTSNTYRQSARTAAESIKIDPDNILLSRGPRFRMPAEMVRDNALAIAGLLSDKMFGPPVFPVQPPNVWRVIGNVDNKYYTSTGEDRWRRGIYTIWRRSAPYPSFMNFDATDRSLCTARRARTNTPLQALTLMNDPVYVEAAKALASRIQADVPEDSVGKRVEYAFALCVSRHATAEESAFLTDLYQRELARAKTKPAASRPAGVASAEQEAWFYVATVLLNLDETITKG